MPFVAAATTKAAAMEQHTWPHASAGHAFSTIPASDYTETDLRPAAAVTKLSALRSRCWGEAIALELQIRNPKTSSNSSSITSTSNGNSKDHHRRDRGRKDRKPSSCGPITCYGDPRLNWSETSASISKQFSSLLRSEPNPGPIHNPNPNLHLNPNPISFYKYSKPKSANAARDFAMLPDDILLRICGAFSWQNLWDVSRVCHSWYQAMAPLREAMLFVHWGKKFKHGLGGVSRNLDKALDSFLKGASRGCTAAMVDAGFLLWEMGQKDEGLYWYKHAAELGDSGGQCNLGLAYLQNRSNPIEAVKWFQKAALAGHVRAQYSLALCLQKGRGVECSPVKAARWYQHAAEGGSTKAMYNLALCYKKGEGINCDFREARRWMKKAACAGHRKAQFEHGLTLFAESDGGQALVFLELATRAGESAATHLRDALLQQLPPEIRTRAISHADKWQAEQNKRDRICLKKKR